MPQNFSRAKHTVIHDLDVRKYPPDRRRSGCGCYHVVDPVREGLDGSGTKREPVERARRQGAFQNANPQIPDPVIKDLQQDILSFSSGGLPDLAYLDAAQIIQGVLGADRLGSRQGAHSSSRGWSWCPPSVFDLDNMGYSVVHTPAADIQRLREGAPVHLSKGGDLVGDQWGEGPGREGPAPKGSRRQTFEVRDTGRSRPVLRVRRLCLFTVPTKIEAPLLMCLIGEDVDEHGFLLSVMNANDEVRDIVREALVPRTLAPVLRAKSS
ncbi:hypothetical protein DL765_011541 [Monosporascus sp. GIB2]|nr:hypothetical protein DL765_011541 [Monosporascus sp. GIB2]